MRFRRTFQQKLRNWAMLAGIYGIVLFFPLFIAASGGPILRAELGEYWWSVPVAVLCVLATAAPWGYVYYKRWFRNRILADEHRYHHSLTQAASGMVRIKEIDRLSRLIVYMVNHTVELTHSGLFIYEPKEQRYILKAVRHREYLPNMMTVDQNDPLIGFLKDRRDLVLLEELRDDLRRRPPRELARQLEWVYAWMRRLELKLIVPSFANGTLLGFLILGAKRSGQRYSSTDLAIFSGLGNQATLAIENAVYFEQLRRSEAYMIQSEKLASLGQLASGMAHEIHNPLTIISGEAQLYLDRFGNQHPHVDEVMNSIIEECRRAADITRRILRFAKPSPPDMVPLDVRATVDETLALAGYQVRMDKFESVVEFPENLPKVNGNQNQLQEVFLNLILNACQAMGHEGGRLYLSAAASSAHVEVKVRDSGPGIPTNKLRKVFEPFYTTKQAGTGLGLFVTQRIIQAHGGSIEVESQEGKGTCFTIRFPIR